MMWEKNSVHSVIHSTWTMDEHNWTMNEHNWLYSTSPGYLELTLVPHINTLDLKVIFYNGLDGTCYFCCLFVRVGTTDSRHVMASLMTTLIM